MSVLMLSSCKSYERVRTVHIKPRVPQVLLQECTGLREPKGTSGADMYAWGIGVVQQYRVCKARHKALVELVSTEVEAQESLEPLAAKQSGLLKK